MKKLLIVTGELSGSIYGERIAGELSPYVKLYGVLHREVKGVERIYDSKRITAFGLFEALKKLPQIIKTKRLIADFLEREKPDAVLLIDFPGFNLKVAAEAKKRGIKVLYFIPPKLWAWGEGRAKKLKELVDRLFVIFPFEVDFYRRFGIEATFVGNPLFEIARPKLGKEEFFGKTGLKEPLYALLPGSRESEIKYLLEPLLETARGLKGEKAIPVASTVNFERVKRLRDKLNPQVALLKEEARYELMAYSELGVIASGTASLEAALLNLPHVVVYRLNPLTYFIAKRVVKTEFVSLPNVIAGREVIPELLQERVNPKEILRALDDLEKRKKEIKEALKTEVAGKLEGNCFKRLSEEILEELS
ncbi:lipid-A-disaccharide synthase [Thermovibrio sp.]